MMRGYIAIALAALLLGGCVPKMGQDIVIEPEGNVRLENTGVDVLLGVLSLLGAPVDNGPIRVGTDLKVINNWHSDLKVVSLTYALEEANEVVARGNGKIGESGFVVIPAGSDKTLPLVLKIDPEKLTPKRLERIYRDKRTLLLKGDLVVEVWGWRKHYRFEKEATRLIEKALRGERR